MKATRASDRHRLHSSSGDDDTDSGNQQPTDVCPTNLQETVNSAKKWKLDAVVLAVFFLRHSWWDFLKEKE